MICTLTIIKSASAQVRVGGQGRVEPPTFRFSGGLACPGKSTKGRLTRPYDALAPSEVQDYPHVSTAVVSEVLARSAYDKAVIHAPVTGLVVAHPGSSDSMIFCSNSSRSRATTT